MNVYDASRTQRSFSGSLTANLARVHASSAPSTGASSSTARRVRASGRLAAHHAVARRAAASRRPGLLGCNGEYNNLIVERKTQRRRGDDVDQSLTRFDLTPQVRSPFKQWQFLTVNTSAACRYTFWTEQQDTARETRGRGHLAPVLRPAGQRRRPGVHAHLELPGQRYAEKFKHSVEPYFNVQRISAIDNFNQIVQLDYVDLVVGSTTRLGYGLANRFFRKPPGGRSREIGTVTIGQTYYTDARASLYDQVLPVEQRRRRRTSSRPCRSRSRAVPTDRITANFRAEYDTKFSAFRTMGADGTAQVGHVAAGDRRAGASGATSRASLASTTRPASTTTSTG